MVVLGVLIILPLFVFGAAFVIYKTVKRAPIATFALFGLGAAAFVPWLYHVASCFSAHRNIQDEVGQIARSGMDLAVLDPSAGVGIAPILRTQTLATLRDHIGRLSLLSVNFKDNCQAALGVGATNGLLQSTYDANKYIDAINLAHQANLPHVTETNQTN